MSFSFKYKHVGTHIDDRIKINQSGSVAEQKLIGFQTPLSIGAASDGIFKMHFSLEAQIHDNFRNLLLTNKGERLGDYNFGTDLQPLALELSKENFESTAMSRIKSAVKKYMPFVSLKTMTTKIATEGKNNTAKYLIQIEYSVPKLSIDNKGIEVVLYAAG